MDHSNSQEHESADKLQAYTDAVLVWLGVAPRVLSITAEHFREHLHLWSNFNTEWWTKLNATAATTHAPTNVAPQKMNKAQHALSRRTAQAEGSRPKQAPRQTTKKR